MAYKVTIKYDGIKRPDVDAVAPIARMFIPNNSYVDSEVFTEGGPVGNEAKYGKSIYATNTQGFGDINVPEPYATTSIPLPTALAQFKFASLAEDGKIELTVENYSVASYYSELGASLKEQGFTVDVEKVE